MKKIKKHPLFRILLLLIAALTAQAQIDVPPRSSDATYQISERGQDFSVYRKISAARDSTGHSIQQTNQFTLLENAIHYRDPATGEWKESADVIESFAEGAVARRGPHKAIFAHELNSQVVFDIQASDGKRIRGGVRAIQLTDTRTHQTITLGSVKNSVTAQILPPNSILFADAFDGLKADVVINWKHQAWSHDVLLREKPELPPGWDAATTRLEVLTEFIVEAEPELRGGKAPADRPESANHTVIDFGAMAMLVGKAFSVAENGAMNFGGDLRKEGAPVRKHWQRTEDGRHFLIEALDWRIASQSMKDLPVRRHASANKAVRSTPENLWKSEQSVVQRSWPKTPPALRVRKPIQLASAPYNPRGYLLDFTTISGSSPTTLTSGTTYYIKTSYGGSSITIQADARIKFKSNAYMIFYGSASFPSSGTKATFTSRNDDSLGDRIASVSGEADSNGDPSSHQANPAIWIYNDTSNLTIRNSRILWAKVGIQIDDDDDSGTRTISDCIFENITGTGSAGVAGSPRSDLTISNLKYCRVTTPGVTMTLDCSDCIANENAWPGDSGWALTSAATAGWPASSSSTTPEIEGFASLTSVNVGSSIDLYVDVRTGTNKDYKIEIYRMGWYNGVGGRKMAWSDSGTSVTSVTKTSSQPQPVPSINASDEGIVDCLAGATPWTLSRAGYTLNVPSWWLSGVYLAKLTEVVGGKQSYIIFTVREDTRGSDLLVQSSVATWEAYNPWGGNSLYPYPLNQNCYETTGGPGGPKVSFNRPYAGPTCPGGGTHDWNLHYGTGAGEFMVQIGSDERPAWEYNAVRWLEKKGYDITYCTSVDTHLGSLTSKPVKAFVSLGHDEYWSKEMRDNVEDARDLSSNPVNLIFLSSNTCYWRIHFASGSNPRWFTCAKPYADNWRTPTTPAPAGQNNPEISLIGVEWAEFANEPMTLTNPSGGHWAFVGTGISAGTSESLEGLLGYEVDGCYLTGSGCGSSTATCPNWGTGDYSTIALADTASVNPGTPCLHSYATIYRASLGPTTDAPNSHAQVFATGSMQWCWGLDDFGYHSIVTIPSYVSTKAQQLTHNVIQKFTGK